MFKKFSTAAGLLLISISMTAACGGNNEPAADSCEESQVEVGADVPDGNGGVAIAKGCYETCDPNGNDCASGETCTETSLGGLCVGGSTANNTNPNNMNTNNTSANNTSANNTSANNTAANNTNNTSTTPNNSNTGNTSTTPPNTNTGNGIDDAGAACASDADCDGTCIATEQFPGGYCSSLGCTADTECGQSGVCVNVGDSNACLASCADESDCREGYACQDDGAGGNICFPQPPDPGAACSSDADCGGAVCFGIGEQGYCAFGCDMDNPCPTGFSCGLFNQVGDNIGICQPDCTEDSECRSDLVCTDTDADNDSECFIEVASGPGGPADPCTEITDCSGGLDGFCIEEDMGEFVGGYCTFVCEEDSECTEGSHCGIIGGVSQNNPNLGICVKDCATGADCSSDQFCGDPDQDNVNECWGQEITPPCTMDTDCNAGEVCSLKGRVGGTAEEGLCLASCAADADCDAAAGETCADANGDGANVCFPGEFADGAGTAGDACTSTGDCAGGVDGTCLEEGMDMNGNTTFPGGYCTTLCSDVACNADEQCIALPTDEMGGTVELCLANCTAGAGCRQGYECLDPATGMPTTGDGICF